MLADVVRFEEECGSTTKYYHVNTIVLSYSLLDSPDTVVEGMIDAIKPQIMDALDLITVEYGESIEEITTEMQTRDHSRNQRYKTYVLLTVLRRVFVRTHRARERRQLGSGDDIYRIVLKYKNFDHTSE